MAGRSVRGEEPDPTPTAAAETMASGLTPPARLEERPPPGGGDRKLAGWFVAEIDEPFAG